MNIPQELRILASRIETEPELYRTLTEIQRSGDQILSLCIGDEQEQKAFIVGLTEYLMKKYSLIATGSFVSWQECGEKRIGIVIHEFEDGDYLLYSAGSRILDIKKPSEVLPMNPYAFVEKLCEILDIKIPT